MTEGFRTHLPSGGIQIDQTFRNFALRSKGTLTPSTSWNNGKWRMGTLTVTGNSQCLAWRSATPCAMVYASRSGTSVTYTFLIASTSGTVDWWLFDDPAYGTATGQIGQILRHPVAGNVLYDSRMKYMRVVGSVTGDYSSLVAPSAGTYTGTPAIVTGNSAYQYVSNLVSQAGNPPYPWTDFVFYPMASANSNQLSWNTQQSDPVTHQPSQTFQSGGQQNSYNYLIVDVANL